MKPNLLVHRYAKALLELAIQKNVVDKVLYDLLLVKKTIEGNKELNILIQEPFVTKVRKISILKKLFGERVDAITIDFLSLLIEKNRDTIITNVYDEYYELYLEYKKIAVVTVTTAVAIDEKTTSRIVDIIRHKIVNKDSIDTKNVIDSSIIGGFIVSYKDYEYDASIKHTLKRLGSVFEDNLFVKGY